MAPEQIFIVGIVASVLTQLFKLLADKAGYRPPAEVKVAVLFVVSVALAAVFGLPELPPFSEPFAFVTALLQAAIGVFGAAALIYEGLAKRVIFPAVRLG